jgi:nucleoside-diphosphate-sugar epimerase
MIERNGVPRKFDRLDLDAMCEQLPDPDSRITLSDRQDRFGTPLARVDWRVHEEEARTLRRMGELVAKQLPRMGLPAPTLAEWVRDGAGLPRDYLDVAHPTGTTRMSVEPATGVVDENCQVHGVRGLYVAGSSVFPTAGHCNPTQTIVAMAVRLADHLRATISWRDVVHVRGANRRQILVTGGTGRIGRVVIDDLVGRGFPVRATTSKPIEGLDDRAGAVEWRRFDFISALAADYEELLAGCEAVLHLAAEIGKADRMQQVNVEATRQLAEAAERAAVSAFCYASSVAVYGSGRRRVTDEDSPVLTIDRDVRSEYWALDYVRTYGRTKLGGERVIRSIARSVPYVILRPTVVVDIPDIVAIRDWSPAMRAFKAHRHAHHVFVKDVSEAFIWSMERACSAGVPGRVETFNISEDDTPNATYGAFLRRAYAATGDPRFRVPKIPGIADWLHDFFRFRTLPLRNPLWRMRFPADRLRAAGFEVRYGMEHAYCSGVASLRSLMSTGPSATEYDHGGLRDGTAERGKCSRID